MLSQPNNAPSSSIEPRLLTRLTNLIFFHMSLKSTYLVVYNLLQVILWTTVLLTLCLSVITTDASTYLPSLKVAKTAQTLAWLEVLHAFIGFGGSVSTSVIQTLGRYIVLVFVAIPIPLVHGTTITAFLLLSWSLADVIRYAFYISTLLTLSVPWLLWLRYSMFLLLYPIGAISEWLIYYQTLSFIDQTNMYAVRLPNTWNFSFDFGIWNRIILLLYFYVIPFMFLHMSSQRRKKLNPSS